MNIKDIIEESSDGAFYFTDGGYILTIREGSIGSILPRKSLFRVEKGKVRINGTKYYKGDLVIFNEGTDVSLSKGTSKKTVAKVSVIEMCS